MSDDKRILLVIDMQNDFISGSLALPGAKKIVPGIKDAVEEFKDKSNCFNYKNRVVFTRDTHGWDYLNTHEGQKIPVTHCVKDTPGWCIVDDLAELAARNYILNKRTFGVDWKKYFEGEDWDIYSVDITGVASDICVVSNALILRQQYPEIDIRVHKNLCAGTSPEMHEKAMDIMKSFCIEVV